LESIPASIPIKDKLTQEILKKSPEKENILRASIPIKDKLTPSTPKV